MFLMEERPSRVSGRIKKDPAGPKVSLTAKKTQKKNKETKG